MRQGAFADESERESLNGHARIGTEVDQHPEFALRHSEIVEDLPTVFVGQCAHRLEFNLNSAVGGEFFSRRGAERQRMLRKLQICSFIAVTRTICCFTL